MYKFPVQNNRLSNFMHHPSNSGKKLINHYLSVVVRRVQQFKRTPCRSEGSHVRLSARQRPTEPNPVKIPTKAMTLCLPRDPVARPAGRSVAPPAASSGRRSQATETESGCEESGQRPRGASAGARERETAAARNPARPKRRQAAETAGEERRRRSEERREAAAAEEENTLGELGMAAAAPRALPRIWRAGWGATPRAAAGAEAAAASDRSR